MDEYVDITPYQSIQERCATNGWDALTDAERELLCLYDCLSLTHSGSLRAFLAQCDPDRRMLAVRGFLRVGATGVASVVRRAVDLFPGDGPPLDAGVDGSPLDRLTTEFYRVNDWGTYPPGGHVGDGENASRLADVYAKTHPTEFRGPRTLPDWRRSRFARGAVDPRWRVEALEREAASDRQLTDEECPSCGQPMPGYRKSCKRCGWSRRPA